jgi:putative transposase
MILVIYGFSNCIGLRWRKGMPRQARFDSPETLHHVIICGIGDLSEETKTRIYAWALMSNHMHILLNSGLNGLSKFVRRLLQASLHENSRGEPHGYF